MAKREWNDDRIRPIIGNVLRFGVLLAALLVFVGGAIFLARHGGEPVALARFHGEPENLKSVSGIVVNATALHGRGLIQLGLLLLIATPVAQVAFSAIAFGLQRDRLYVVIALIVLGFLIFSLADGRL